MNSNSQVEINTIWDERFRSSMDTLKAKRSKRDYEETKLSLRDALSNFFTPYIGKEISLILNIKKR